MANVTEQVKKIRETVYGRDVRESIASGLEAMNDQCNETEQSATQKINEMSTLKTSLDRAEEQRANAERARATNESVRMDAENARVNAETARTQGFAQLEKVAETQQNKTSELQITLDESLNNLKEMKESGAFDGSKWLAGSGVPSGVGKDGDWYVDTSSNKWRIYHYQSGAWIDTGNDLIGQDGGLGGDTVPIGVMLPSTTNITPDGWLLCNGALVSRKDYAELFDVIGTSYGTGDGSTTFALPNEPNPLTHAMVDDNTFQMLSREPELYMIIKAKQLVPVVASVEDSLASDSTVNVPSVHTVSSEIKDVKKEISNIESDIKKYEGITNPNLLINGDFMIWSNGTEIHGSGICADMWTYVQASTAGTVNVKKASETGGITMTTTEPKIMSLRARLNKTDRRLIRNKPVVLSYSINGVIHVHKMDHLGTIWLQDDQVMDGYHVSYDQLSNKDALEICVLQYQMAANQTVTIDWIKLEYGTVATPHYPESYDQAYARCAPYYLQTKTIGHIAYTNVSGEILSVIIHPLAKMDGPIRVNGLAMPFTINFRTNGTNINTTVTGTRDINILPDRLVIAFVLSTPIAKLQTGYVVDDIPLMLDATPID